MDATRIAMVVWVGALVCGAFAARLVARRVGVTGVLDWHGHGAPDDEVVEF